MGARFCISVKANRVIWIFIKQPIARVLNAFKAAWTSRPRYNPIGAVASGGDLFHLNPTGRFVGYEAELGPFNEANREEKGKEEA